MLPCMNPLITKGKYGDPVETVPTADVWARNMYRELFAFRAEKYGAETQLEPYPCKVSVDSESPASNSMPGFVKRIRRAL